MSFPTPPSDGDWPTRESQPSMPIPPPFQPSMPAQPSQPAQPGYPCPGYTTVPIYGPTPQMPPTTPQPQKRPMTRGKAAAIGCGSILVVCALCGLLVTLANGGNGGNASVTATAKPTATPNPNANAPQWAAMVYADTSTLTGDLDTISTDCGNDDFSACRANVVTLRSDVNSFLSDLKANPAPPCMHATDQYLRAGLQDYQQGSSKVIAGLDNLDPNEISAGTALFSQGTSQITKASNAAKAAHC